jgi:hypothetical protein
MLANIGITYLPAWMVAAQLRSGTVKAVLTDHTCAPTPINAVYSASRRLVVTCPAPHTSIAVTRHATTLWKKYDATETHRKSSRHHRRQYWDWLGDGPSLC